MERTIQPLADNGAAESPHNNAYASPSFASGATAQPQQFVSSSQTSNSPNPATGATSPQVQSLPVSSPAQVSNVATVYTAPNADVPTPEIKSAAPAPMQFLTGSQLEQEKTKLPVGIYILVAFGLIDFALSFFNTSETSTIFAFVMLGDLLVSIGLLFRLEIAREIMVLLAGVSVVLSVTSILLLIGLQERIQTDKTNFQNAVSKINQQEVTVQQRQEIASLESQISNAQKRAGKTADRDYVAFGISIVEGVVVIIYLTRAGVKGVFRELEK